MIVAILLLLFLVPTLSPNSSVAGLVFATGIVSLALFRKGESILRVCPHYPANPATLEFFLSEINNLELVGFAVKT